MSEVTIACRKCGDRCVPKADGVIEGWYCERCQRWRLVRTGSGVMVDGKDV
jgi:hypothetical protein